MDTYLQANPSGDVVRVEGGVEMVLHCPLSSRPSNGHCRIDCAWWDIDRLAIDSGCSGNPTGARAICRSVGDLGAWRV